MTATAESWQKTPFGDVRPIPYRDRFSAGEFQKLREGLVPKAMEDKWFVYFEAPFLYFHRSWTGDAVYRAELAETGDGGADVKAAVCSAEGFEKDMVGYEAAVLDFLIGALLLGKDKIFPLPEGLEQPASGTFQHVVAGTGARETVFPIRRQPWWRFWR